MKTVLLVTGWASPKEIWSPVCSLLSDDFLLQVVTAHEVLEVGPEIWKRFSDDQTICVGWSMGGMLLLEAISNGLISCEALVLVSSAAKMSSQSGLLERTLKQMRIRLESDPKGVVREFWQNLRAGDERFLSYSENQSTLSHGLSYLADSDFRPSLGRIKVPTSIIHGSLDPIIPIELGQQLAVGITNSKFVSVEAGHDLPLVIPEIIASEIRAISVQRDSIAEEKLEFSNSAENYDRWAEPQRVIGENLLSLSEEWQPDTGNVLDIGCGTGFMVASFKKRHPRAKVTGLDSAQGMIDFCQKRFKDCADCSFLLGEAESKLPTGPWNLILSNSTLQWIDDFKACLSLWKEELSENGKIVFSTLVSGSFSEFEDSYLKAAGRKSSSLSWKDSASYLDALRDSGFNIFCQEEKTFKFSYKNALEALLIFKRIGAINNYEKPLTVTQTRELIRYYQANFPAAHGGVQVSYKALFVVAATDSADPVVN